MMMKYHPDIMAQYGSDDDGHDKAANLPRKKAAAMNKSQREISPLDLVKATGAAPPAFRKGSVTYHVAPAAEIRPESSRMSLRRPDGPAMEKALADDGPLQLVRVGPEGVLTHPNGKRRID